jgi:hypothetical protein
MYVIRSEFELETIVRRIDDEELDLQPDFQRGEIWDRKRRQRLIDSLLREWYVPAVHIVRGGDGARETVLDGQQRLAAVRDFFHDGFPVDGNTVPRSEFIESLDGLKFSKLPPQVRRSLQRFPLPCITLRDFAPDEPNELFFRLNQSYNLTPSEKRNALHGEARNQVRNLVSELIEIGLLDKSVVGFTNGRLAYDDIVARACLAIERGDLRLHINNNVVEDFYRKSSFSSVTIRGVRHAGQLLHEMALVANARMRFNKATLFSWLVFCYWVPLSVPGGVPERILADFESNRQALKRSETPSDLPPEIINIVSLYDDRASYRVTDVSSVLARDCGLYLYFQGIYGAPSIRNSSQLLAQLVGLSETRAQQEILDFVSSQSWGQLPSRDEAL